MRYPIERLFTYLLDYSVGLSTGPLKKVCNLPFKALCQFKQMPVHANKYHMDLNLMFHTLVPYHLFTFIKKIDSLTIEPYIIPETDSNNL